MPQLETKYAMALDLVRLSRVEHTEHQQCVRIVELGPKDQTESS